LFRCYKFSVKCPDNNDNSNNNNSNNTETKDNNNTNTNDSDTKNNDDTNSTNNNFTIDFYGLDTNGAQRYVLYSHPGQGKLLRDNYKPWLVDELNSSKSDWKIVFGHHPLYTQGVF
jgi:hypothetical protein